MSGINLREFLVPQVIRGRAYQARLVYFSSLVITLGAFLLALFMLLTGPYSVRGFELALPLIVFVAGIVSQGLLRRGDLRLSSYVLIGALLAVYLISAALLGDRPSIFLLFAIVALVAGLLLSRRGALAVTALAIAATIAILLAHNRDALPKLELTIDGTVSTVILLGELIVIGVLFNLAFATLNRAIGDAKLGNRKLRQNWALLEKRVEERTRDLTLVAEISRQLSELQELDLLLSNAVDLIRDRFDLYYVQVYLTDGTGRELIMRAGTGEIGAELQRRGHRLPLQAGSINATAALSRAPVLVNNTLTSPIFKPNPLLPDTRSEASIPMMIEDRVVGVLNLQSNEPHGLTEDSLTAFSSLAAQLAIAVENARLFTGMAEARRELERQARRLTEVSWADTLEGGLSPKTFRYAAGSRQSATAPAAIEQEQVPITVRGATIGYLGFQQTPDPGHLSSENVVSAIANQLGAHLENLRLAQQAELARREAEQNAAEMQRINSLVSNLAASTSLRQSMQTIVDELADALNVQQVGVALLNESRNALRVFAEHYDPTRTPSALGVDIPIEGNPATQQVIRTRRPVIISDPANNPLTASAGELLRRRGVQTIYILPMIVGNEVIGTVGIDLLEKEAQLDERRLRLAETIVLSATSAVERARLLADVTTTAEQLSVTNQVAQVVAQHTDLDGMLEAVYELLQRVARVDVFVVGLYSAADHLLELPLIIDNNRRFRQPPQTPEAGSRLVEVSQSGRPLRISRTPAEVEALSAQQPATAIGVKERISASLIYAPLRTVQRTIGAISIQSYEYDVYSESDVELLSGIASHVAAALENVRLLGATEAGRMDAELLYNLSAALNAARSYDEILLALVQSGMIEGASSVSIAAIEVDPSGEPEWTTISALWADKTWRDFLVEAGVTVGPGTRFYLKGTRFAQAWREGANQPIFIEDVAEDERVDEPLKAFLATLKVQSTATLALQVRDQWIGLLAVSWQELRRFGERDYHLFRAAATQFAVAISNQQLFEQAQSRSRQLEKLSHIETELSQTLTEDEMIQTLLRELGSEALGEAALQYVTVRESDSALMLETASLWQGGVFQPRSTFAPPTAVSDAPLSSLWLSKPRTPLIIEDVQKDRRLNNALRNQAKKHSWHSIVLLPLWRGGRWEGAIHFAWNKPRKLPADEAFLFPRLLEPLAATVATRRAYLAQASALAQTESLLNISARLNAAQSFADILQVVRDHASLGNQADLIRFAYFDRPWLTDSPPQSANVLAQLGLPSTDQALPRFQMTDIPALRWLRPDWPIVFTDILDDRRLDPASQAFLSEPGDMRSAVIAPVSVAGQWVGYLSLSYRERPQSFSAGELGELMSVLDQIAVAAQTIVLLEQTKQLLVSERRQRAIADTLLASARALSETLDEGALRERLLGLLTDTLPQAASANLYEWRQDDNVFILDRQRVVSSTHPDQAVISPGRVGERLTQDEQPDLWQVFSTRQARIRRTGPDGQFVESYLLPWRVGRETAGVIEICYTRSDANGRLSPTVTLTDEDQRRCEGIVRQAALAIQNARLYSQTQTALGAQARLTAELRAVAEVGTAAAATLEVDRLLQQVVDLTRASFDLYHAHIYLLNETGDTLVLRAGAGKIGRQMVAENRTIPIGANSLVARAARRREAVLVEDTRQTPDFLPHPLLPKTRSELAVPMIVGDTLIGVLDVQDSQVGRFNQDDVLVQKTLAAQVAVAVQNAYYFAEQIATTEKLREVDRLKSDFLASMSHELRTPLNSIIGFADVLLMGIDGELNERMEEDVRLIQASGQHLRSLIGDILDMSKIEAGKMELYHEKFNVRSLVEELVSTISPLAASKGLELRLQIDDNVNVITADRTRLRQVLWNIIGNAIKFTQTGHIDVAIERDNSQVRFSVADTGIGIAAEDLPHIFDQFRQIENRNEAQTSGTGLGLSISKSLIDLHGGSLQVESAPGLGSRFSFTIPDRTPAKVEQSPDYLTASATGQVAL